MSNYAAGRRREYRTQRILEQAGYQTIRAASSKGLFDVVAFRPFEVRFISVKSGSAYASGVERELMQHLKNRTAPGVTMEIWRYPDRCKEPLIEVL